MSTLDESATWTQHTLAEIPLNLNRVLINGDGLTWNKSALVLLCICLYRLLLLHGEGSDRNVELLLLQLQQLPITGTVTVVQGCGILFLVIYAYASSAQIDHVNFSLHIAPL